MDKDNPYDSRQLLRVTYLELREAPASLVDRVGSDSIGTEHFLRADYLALYGRVGGLLRWDQRMLMPAAELHSLLAGNQLTIYVVRNSHSEALGFCEFDRNKFPEIELKNFGLVPEARGRGLGPWLLSTGLREEWKSSPTRIWLHTDTWDHPAAIRVYERQGFRVFAIRDETAEAL